MLFELQHVDIGTGARAGILHTDHGDVETPVFMPVGTQAAVKTVSPRELKEAGVVALLGNTYHLHLRPGLEVVEAAGGLHRFMDWEGPILTDSGGYQVFSMQKLRSLSVDGVEFRSHLDGSTHFFSPSRVIEIERSLGADIMMVLDECATYPCAPDDAAAAVERTTEWAERSVERFEETSARYGWRQFLFGIVQGGTYHELRRSHAQSLTAMDFDGYAVGGLAVGEPSNQLYEMTELTCALLPEDRPRYLMGVGRPLDIVKTVRLGVDMFDCVIPTRNGRNGMAYTFDGRIVLTNKSYSFDMEPIDEACGCYTCRHYSRAYLRHLFKAEEILAKRATTVHNLHFYMEFMRRAREAILADEYAVWSAEFAAGQKGSEALGEEAGIPVGNAIAG